eukprot:884813_1
MSVVKAIKFRQLIVQLTNEECLGFLSKLLNSHMDTIITSLFEHFVNQCKTNQIDELDTFNESLSDIIQSRKEKSKAVSVINIKLNQLPTALIGHTASFLDLWDYDVFSLSCRSVYLGCQSPNMLQELDLLNMDHSSINIALFPSVKTLIIEPEKAIEVHSWSFDSPIFNHVATVHLHAHHTQGWVERFLNQNILNWTTVTTLNLSCTRSEMDRNEFLNLLSKCPNLKRLGLNIDDDTANLNDATAKEIAKKCPKIVGLYLTNCDDQFCEELISLFGSKLKYVSLPLRSNQFDFKKIAFDKLEEVEMTHCATQSLNAVLKAASSLKKISIGTSGWSNLDHDTNIMLDIGNATMKLIAECPRLTYLRLKVNHNEFGSMMKGIECGLLKIKRQRRLELKVHISIQSWSSDAKTDDFTLYVGRLVNALESSAIDDFMFIGECYRMNEIFKDLCNVSLHTQVIQRKNKFIIANSNCKINGFRDSICSVRNTFN